MSSRSLNSLPGVIFDLDGTLVDTIDDIHASLHAALLENDRPPLSLDQTRSMVGEGLRMLVQRAAQESDPILLDRLVADYKKNYTARMFERIRLYPGVHDLLDQLAARHVPMCVLSNKSHEFTLPICTRILERWPFVRCQGFSEGGPRKPDPGAALQLAHAMDRDASNVFFVGDSAVDMQTAHAARMSAVAVTWGYRGLDELVPARPDHIIHQPAELLSILVGVRHVAP